MEYELGVDEAGRGPVIGPMVYAACIWPVSQRDDYKLLGFDDSKKLTPQRREELFQVINSLPDAKYYIKASSSEELSNAMLRKTRVSLNTIAFDSAESVIRQALQAGYNVTHCYLDTVGPPAKYAEHLHCVFDSIKPGIEFTVEAKADSTYPIVSAASICAKVTRDRFVSEISDVLGDVGCGYPSDPKTVKWMEDHCDPVFGFDARYVRLSWETSKTMMKSKGIVFQWKDVEEDKEQRPPGDNLFEKKPRKSPLQKILRLAG